MYKIHPKKKYQLFKQSETFCSVPWNLVYIYTNGEIKTCTPGNLIMGSIKEQPIEEVLQSHKYTTLREDLYQEKTCYNCKNCLQSENSGNKTETYHYLRDNYNSMFRHADIDYQSCNEFVLGAVDLHWSSTCDLKCVTCWAEQSSSIANEQGIPVRHTPKQLAENFIDFVNRNQHTLQEVYLSGGEPTLIKYNLTLLKKLNKRSDLLLRVNSNMMWDQDNAIIKEILKFPNVLFTCSADALGEKFEYIRRGASWKKFIANLYFLQKQPNVEIRINSVFFVLQSTQLIETIEYFKFNMGIKNFTINKCGMGHTYLRCRNLPEHVKQKVKQDIIEAIEKYNDDLNLVGQLKNCYYELEVLKTDDYADYLDNIDSIEGTNWREVFKDIV